MLAGSVEVLQKQLAAARADLAAARDQQLADALTAQALSRRVEEVRGNHRSRVRAGAGASLVSALGSVLLPNWGVSQRMDLLSTESCT